MHAKFLVSVSSKFEREARKIKRPSPRVDQNVEDLIDILEQDPYNSTHRHHIKKLLGVAQGKGQWRIRSGNYRLRYDIFDKTVVLYSIRDRKDAY